MAWQKISNLLGPQGNQGLQGVQGIQGNPGSTGSQGPQGIQGPVGPSGPQGVPGTGLRLLGSVPTSANLPTTGNTAGDMWLATDTGHVWCWDGTAWTDVGVIVGPAGPQGNPGPAGTSSFAHITANFGVPNVGQSVAPVYVDVASWMIQNQILWIETAGGGANAAALQITQIVGNALTLVNITGQVGATVAVGALVSPGGPQGVTGAQGPAGTGINFKGTVATFSALPTTGNVVGDMWITSDTGHGWIWAANNAWSDAGPIQGPPGVQGPQGNPGAPGAAGPSGPPGDSITFKGNVATSSALPASGNNIGDMYVTNDTGHAWIWSDAVSPTAWMDSGPWSGPPGPQGDQGQQGIQGNPGPSGPIGATGPIGPVGPVGPTGNPGPAGATGANGVNAFTSTSSQFTVPPVGGTVVVTVQNASWLTIGQDVAIQTAGGNPTTAGTLQVQAINGNQVTLLNPTIPAVGLANTSAAGLMARLSGATTDYVGGDNACHSLAPAVRTNVGLASPSQSGLLAQVSGATTDYVGGDNACHDLAGAIQPTIWSQRLRSFNALGNPNFEVDQRNCFATLANPATGTFLLDRWFFAKVPGVSTTINVFSPVAGSPIVVPGTSYCITNRYLRINNQAVYGSPAATDSSYVLEFVEGSQFRELSNDVHSVSLLIRTSLSSLKLGLSIRDNPGSPTRSLTKLITITGPSTWNLITLPNLPLWPSAGTFSLLPGNAAYTLAICLMAGSSSISPANDVWQSGGFIGATGQDNFYANPIGTLLDIAFVQHEPGPPTTLQDKPFTQNYDECLRYYAKSYDYETAPGTATSPGVLFFFQSNTTQINGVARFPKAMAKVPTLTGYSHSTGAVNTIRFNNAVDYAISNFGSFGKGGIYAVNTATLPAVAAGGGGFFHYTADTGW